MRLPRLPQALTFQELTRFAGDLLLLLQTYPAIEYKTVLSNGDFPAIVSTKIANVLEVRRAQSYVTSNPSEVVDDVSICWRKSSDPRQPGIVITELGGLRRGTNYTIVLAIQGLDG